jgi:hypothetical protein
MNERSGHASAAKLPHTLAFTYASKRLTYAQVPVRIKNAQGCFDVSASDRSPELQECCSDPEQSWLQSAAAPGVDSTVSINVMTSAMQKTLG